LQQGDSRTNWKQSLPQRKELQELEGVGEIFYSGGSVKPRDCMLMLARTTLNLYVSGGFFDTKN
jgi:hypothetical protein